VDHVFLSYSRKDTDFVQRLHEALEARGRETWADWEGIPPSDEWMARIHAAIDEAEALVFVISPDSLASEVCGQELDYAIAGHKRIIPVVCREPEGSVREELAKLNWIFARPDDPFEEAQETLLQAVDTDLDWVKAHTRLNVRAREWDRLGREASYTLRGKDLTEFEEWAVKASDKEPKPTALQSEYLLASRRTVTRRQRITWTAVTVGLCVATVLGTLAWLQSDERARQAEIAGARQLLSKAEALREIPAEADLAQDQHEEGLRAATQALATLHVLGENVFDADQSMRKSLARLSKWDEPQIESGNGRYGSPVASIFSPDGDLLAVLTSQSEILLIETTADEVRHRCKRDGDAMERGIERRLTITPDGRRLALRTFGGTNQGAWNRLYVWDLTDCSMILEEQLDDDSEFAIEDIALTTDGTQLIYWNREAITIKDLTTGGESKVPTPDGVRHLAISPDRRSILVATRARGERAYAVTVNDLSNGQTAAAWRIDGSVYRLSWQAGGIVAVTRSGHAVYDVGGTQKGVVTAADRAISTVSPDGGLLAFAVDNQRIEVREVASDALVASAVRVAQFRNLAFASDGRSINVVSDYTLMIGRWYFDAVGPFARLLTSGAPSNLWFADDGTSLSAADEHGEITWRMPSQDSLGAPSVVPNEPVADEPHPVPAPDRVSAFEEEREVLAVAFGEPDREARLVCGESTRGGCRRHLEIWDGGTKRSELPYEPVLDVNQQAILEFAGQDRFLIVGTRTGLEVLDWVTLEPVTELFHGGATLAGVSKDASRAATMDRNHSIRVWDVATGAEQTRLAANGPAHALALSNDGRWLAALTPAGIELWALTPPDLINQACRWLEHPCP